MQVKIHFDFKALDAVLSKLSDKKLINQVIRKGINGAVREVKKSSSMATSEKWNLKKGQISKSIRSKPAKGLNLKGSVTFPAFAVGVEKFPVAKTEIGLGGSISKAGTSSLPHAFFAPRKNSGKKTAFVRTKKIGGGVNRYVMKPSRMAPHRGKSGGELPINRLSADVFKDIRDDVDRYQKVGAGKALSVMVEEVDKLFDLGKVR
jgi:hypothetical protein